MAPQSTKGGHNDTAVLEQTDRKTKVELICNLDAPRRQHQLLLMPLNAAAQFHAHYPVDRGYRRRKGFTAQAMGDRDERGELVRVRLSEQDLARVTAIQDYYEREGMRPALQAVISDAIATHYSVLEAQGSVERGL